MSEQEPDINAAILVELKQMNESLAYIRAVAQKLNEQENAKARGLAELGKFSGFRPQP